MPPIMPHNVPPSISNNYMPPPSRAVGYRPPPLTESHYMGNMNMDFIDGT